MILKARLDHYGFALAMPATLLLVITIVSIIPNILRNAWKNGFVFQSIMWPFIITIIVSFFLVSDGYYRVKKFVVGKKVI